MKIAIYHPNMHYRGGGETVSLTIAEALSKKHDVTVFVTRKPDVKMLEKFFGLYLSRINFRVFGKLITFLPSFSSFKPSMYVHAALSIFDKSDFDYVIDTCSNGLFDKKINPKTICYIHFPNYTRQKKGILSLLNFILVKPKKMFTYDTLICNSKFTEDNVKRMTTKHTKIIYPPVKISEIVPKRKKSKIITVGRYSKEKKHEIMIEAFRELSKEFPVFSMEIIGAYNKDSDHSYYSQLKSMAKGLNIKLTKNMNHDKVLKKLEEANIYWHARGYRETDSVEYENFGITTVEAMAAGCVPVVINLGAQPEIINGGINGYTWDTKEDLLAATRSAILRPSKAMVSKAINDSKKYSKKNFKKKIFELIT